MAVRAQFENSNECVLPLHALLCCTSISALRNEADIVLSRVGVFSTLTNSYALVAVGASENFYRYTRLNPALIIYTHIYKRMISRAPLTQRVTQCVRSRAPRCHSYLPCDHRRHKDYRAADRRVRFELLPPRHQIRWLFVCTGF
jgi:hypothetical protein